MVTEGIKYTGSKRLILPSILRAIQPLQAATILDGFSGTTRVTQALKARGYRVIANDIADWSRVFGQCYLLNRQPASYYLPMINYLNGLPGYDGWFSEHYGGRDYKGSAVQPDGTKKLWQLHNTRKLDAIRSEIDNITSDEIERSVLIASLILAMDKVDSSVGHHVSYLKKWAPRSYNTMKMIVPRFVVDEIDHEVHQEDIFDLVKKSEKVDIAYFDPPYGSSNQLMPSSRVRYASYYHVWKTICLNDQPDLTGVANRRVDVGDRVSGSVFEEFRADSEGRLIAVEAIRRLIKQTSAKTIILSYNNNGRATAEALHEIFDELKLKRKLVRIDHKTNVMATMKWTHEWVNKSVQENNTEFLFVIEKEPSEVFETVFERGQQTLVLAY
jgi:adenine-specific DNA-methyltransferase